MLKSPLRFPGGKSRAIGKILPLIPNFDEYREPMVGGGSIFLALRQRFPNRRYWINDLNYDLYCFWKMAQECTEELVKAIHTLRAEFPEGRTLYYRLLEREGQGDEIERAARFFVLNRITFSGIVGSGGYSDHAFHNRFTHSAIERVRALNVLLRGVRITHGDYAPVLECAGENVFIFLDPPYYAAGDSRLYGRHSNFDHARLAHTIRNISSPWLLTYDDSDFIRKLYEGYEQEMWCMRYSINHYKPVTRNFGPEIFIANYSISSSPRQERLNHFDL